MIYGYTFVIMMGFWVLLSGRFDPFHLTLGVISAALVSWSSADLLFRDSRRRGRLAEAGRFLLYIPWIIKEIGKSTLDVTILALHPRMAEKIGPHLVRFRTSLKSNVAKVTLANSITLTPGTITVRIEDDVFLVHALTPKLSAGMPGEMEERVARIFGEEKR